MMAGAAKGETAGNELNKALGPFGGALPDIERAPDGCYGKRKSKRRRRWRIELGSSGARGNTGRRQTMPDTPPRCPPPFLFDILSIACYMGGHWSADGSEDDANVNRA